MPKERSFVELETQFDEAMATISALYELMQNSNIDSKYKKQTFQNIGCGGLSAVRKAEKAFQDLIGLYLDEQQEIKRYTVEPTKQPKDPLVERAVTLIDKTQTKHTKQ